MIKFAFMIKRLPSLKLEEFIQYHRDQHAPLFMSIPETKQYVRIYTVSHPVDSRDYPASTFDGLTEIWFDSWEDHDLFFASENYKNKVQPDPSKFFDEKGMSMTVTKETVVF